MNADISTQNLRVSGGLTVTSHTNTGSISVTGSTSTGSLAVGSNAACQSLTVSSGTLNMGSNLVLGPGGALANTVLESGLM